LPLFVAGAGIGKQRNALIAVVLSTVS